MPKNLHLAKFLKVLRFSNNEITFEGLDLKIFSETNLVLIEYEFNKYSVSLVCETPDYEKVIFLWLVYGEVYAIEEKVNVVVFY